MNLVLVALAADRTLVAVDNVFTDRQTEPGMFRTFGTPAGFEEPGKSFPLYAGTIVVDGDDDVTAAGTRFVRLVGCRYMNTAAIRHGFRRIF